IILLPVVQRTARVGDEALLPGAPRPAGVIVVDAGVLPAVARDFTAADLEGDHRVLVVAVDDVPGPAATPGDPLVGAVVRTPGLLRVSVDEGAALPLVVRDRQVGKGTQYAAVAAAERA